MTLAELSSLTGAISAISVLISLLFLKIQIRQSEKNQRALIQQGRAGRSVEIAMRLMAADFAEAYHRCTNGDPNVSEIQLVQFIGYCRAIFLGAEDSFLQHRERLLDNLAFSSFTKSLRGLLMSPGIRSAWAITRDSYESEFVDFVEGLVNDTATRPIMTQLAQWKTIVQSEYGLKKAA